MRSRVLRTLTFAFGVALLGAASAQAQPGANPAPLNRPINSWRTETTSVHVRLNRTATQTCSGSKGSRVRSSLSGPPISQAAALFPPAASNCFDRWARS